MTTRLPSSSWLRRCALALSALLGASAAAQGQALTYATTGATTLAGTYTDLPTTTGTTISMANTDDANSAAQNIGFTFSYNGMAFTQFVMNTNGLLRLGAVAPSSAVVNPVYGQTPENGPVNSTNAADVNLLMPFNFDLTAGTSTPDYRVSTTGTMGSRVCTIQWKNVADKTVVASVGSTTSLPTQFTNFSFQVKLYEGSNRIEFVYSAAAVSTNNSLKYAVVGLKGSGNAAGQNVLAVKGSSFDWSTTTFTSGPQQAATVANAHNFRSTFPPDAGRTYRFDPVATNDAAVQVYTLGQVSQTYASPHIVQAAVTNLGSAALTSRTATLTVTGANSLTATQTVPALAVGASTVITFTGYPLTNLGTNTVTVTLPADDVASNNTSSSQQVVSAGRLAYTDPASTATFAGGLGSGAANSLLYVKYHTNSAAVVTNITPTFNLPTVGSTFQVQVYAATGTGGVPAGTPLYTSATQTITTSTAATTVSVAVPSVAVSGDFYVATKQLTATNQSLAYQTESPLRAGTFYFSADGLAFTDLSTSAFPARLALETTLGAPTTPTCAAVTNATITNPTSTATAAAAQLNFTAASGAISYYITLNQTGSTATPATGTITASPLTLTGLTPNTSYTVTITTNCSNGGTSSVVTVVFTSAAPSTATPPANNDCAGAIALTVTPTCTPTTGTTVGATQSLAAIACGGFTGAADDDVWYKFVATATTQTVTVVGGTGFDPVVDVRSGACASTTNIGCADATTTAGTETVTLTNLVVGATYFVRVYDYSAGVTGTFTICVTGAAATCPAPTALAASNVTQTGATLTFTPATGVSSYTVTYTPAGGTAQTQTATGSPVTLANLTPGTTYTVSVVTNCGTGSTSTAATTTFTTLTCPAVTALAAGSITQTGATLTFTPATGISSYTITYTPAGGTAQTQTATGSPVTLANLTPGTTYTVRIVTNCGTGSTSTAATTTFTTLSPCPAVTSLTASSITSTSASLTFAGATGATSYTVTYTPAGGTAQTVTITNSPTTLANLTPGTTYTVSVVTSCGSGNVSTAATTTFTTLTPCTAVTGLAASNVTATGATLTFTPASGATTYTITYTPAGGTAQTQTATGSPVTLAGLQSNKQYTVSITTNCSGQTSAAATTTFTTTQGLAVRAALAGGELAVYPNPAHHAFTVSLPALGTARTAELRLVNALGQVVRHQTISLVPGGTQVPMEALGLPTGVYAVQVRAGGETAVVRLLLN